MKESAREVLKKYWGYDSFRSLQEEIVTSVLNGHDTLGLLPTGGGKSITFQVPGLVLGGLTLVVTPLIALMKDQADHLLERGIKAAAIYMGMTREEIQQTYDKVIGEHYNFLYVSPERLQTQLFQMKLPWLDIRLLVVDEAHCISQWGYDFRPPYLKIADFRKILKESVPGNPDVPCMALTATATPDVVKDICKKLDFQKGYEVHQASFVRPNLTYTVIPSAIVTEELCSLLSRFKVENPKDENLKIDAALGSAIVYARSRNKTQMLAQFLNSNGIPATFYHAGLSSQMKQERQEAWMKGQIPVIVATNAFGMGIDKPNVRLVIHEDLPPSIEEYFQEAGRAGRDGLPATAYLLATRQGMADLMNHLLMSYPSRDTIKMVYERLAYFFQIEPGAGFNHTFEFDIYKFCRAYHLQMPEVYSALKILTMAGYISFNEDPDSHSRMMFLVPRDSFYRLDRFDKDSQNIIMYILRLYTGTFADYQRINEKRLSELCHITREEVYQKLLYLSRSHVLHYIPAREMPTIYYPLPRVDYDEIRIPHLIYEDRLQRETDRAESMINYAFTHDECRLVKLLNYFGEKTEIGCGKCDVCLEGKSTPSEQQVEDLHLMILSYLENNGATTPFMLSTKIGHPELVPKMLREMIAKGELILRNGKVELNLHDMQS